VGARGVQPGQHRHGSEELVGDSVVQDDGQHVVQQHLAALAGPGTLGEGLCHLRLRRVAGRLRAQVAFRAAATLLVSVAYDQGWQAVVDGHRAGVFMLAPALLGVAVPAGHHLVSLRYYCPGGRWWFGLGGLVCTAALVFTGRRSRYLEVGGLDLAAFKRDLAATEPGLTATGPAGTS
jgi:hypothetical protein